MEGIPLLRIIVMLGALPRNMASPFVPTVLRRRAILGEAQSGKKTKWKRETHKGFSQCWLT